MIAHQLPVRNEAHQIGIREGAPRSSKNASPVILAWCMWRETDEFDSPQERI
jgi:hypothetical protein